MKNYKYVLLGLIVSMLVVLTACGGEEETATESVKETESETLIMGTSPDYPPFESLNAEGEFVGFDIELAKLIAEELGKELEIKDMKFDGLIGALQANRVDLVLSGMSATDARRENVDFSTEYHRSGEMFVSKQDDKVESLADLEGKVLGVQLGTIQQEGAEAIQSEYGFEIKALDSATALAQELVSDRVDVIYLDTQVAKGFMESQDLFGIDDPTDASPGMAVAFPKGSDIVEDVNEALARITESGQLAELEAEFLIQD